jgi:hypothetical protein
MNEPLSIPKASQAYLIVEGKEARDLVNKLQLGMISSSGDSQSKI